MSGQPKIVRLYKISEAADILSVSVRHVRNLIADGEIVVVNCGKGQGDARADRIEETELNRFIMRRRVNRGIVGVKECRSISAVKSGGLSSSTTTPLLDSLLARRKRKKPKHLSAI